MLGFIVLFFIVINFIFFSSVKVVFCFLMDGKEKIFCKIEGMFISDFVLDV